MAVQPSQLLDIAKNVLIQMGINDYEDVELTYRSKVGNEWRANFSFMRADSWTKDGGCFGVDAETGEITFSAIGKIWKLGK